MAGLVYYLASHPQSQTTLRNELDNIMGSPTSTPVVDGACLKNLPYLDACIKEALRLLSTLPAGLPRVVLSDMTVEGQLFVKGTVLSVQSSDLHHDATIWGDDVDDFCPERWLEKDSPQKSERDRAFHPFSLGPRACIG